LAALVRDHWGDLPDEDPARVAGSLPFGATLREPGTSRGWVLDDEGSVAAFGAAMAWARRQQVRELHVLVDAGASSERSIDVAGVMARRAEQWASPPQVWTVSGRDVAVAQPAPIPAPIEPAAAAREWIPTLLRHGAEVVVEHGTITGEILGLEVARVVATEASSGWRLAVGVGHVDQDARDEMRPDESIDDALDRVVDLVRHHRAPGRTRHPANTVARERWLRRVLVERPVLVGASELRPVAPPLGRTGLMTPAVAPAVGTDVHGRPLVVVCATGIHLDLVPAAADVRVLCATGGEAASARLVLVVPEVDDYPLTRELARDLAWPADVVAVPAGWESLAGE
jgi:hypothetical protein